MLKPEQLFLPSLLGRNFALGTIYFVATLYGLVVMYSRSRHYIRKGMNNL